MPVRKQLAHAHASACTVQITNRLTTLVMLKGSRGRPGTTHLDTLADTAERREGDEKVASATMGEIRGSPCFLLSPTLVP